MPTRKICLICYWKKVKRYSFPVSKKFKDNYEYHMIKSHTAKGDL